MWENLKLYQVIGWENFLEGALGEWVFMTHVGKFEIAYKYKATGSSPIAPQSP